MGHAFDVAVLKLKSNERIGKKKQFSGLLFFYRFLKLVHQQLGLLGPGRSQRSEFCLNIFSIQNR